MQILRRLILITLFFYLAACSIGPAPLPSPIPKNTPVVPQISPKAPVSVETPTPSETATLIPEPTSGLTPTSTTLPISEPHLVVLAGDLPGPDDLILGPDNSIYLSDVVDGTIRRYTTDGRLEVFLTGLNEPEGLVFLPDGSLVIAEQGANRLVRYDPKTKNLTVFLVLENKTANLGVDGITLAVVDNKPAEIIIPDSPNGSILQASLDGHTVTQLSRSFVRPTGVCVETDGSLLVVDENAGTLSRLYPNGEIEVIAHLPTPDDVVEDKAGNIFVNTLGDGAIHLFRAGTKRDEVLIKGLSSPQGLILDENGNLIVTDPGNHRLVNITIH